MTHATVTLNGTQVADHLGGYLPFSAEITGLLRPDGNVLAVRLDSGFNLNVPPDRPAPEPATSVDYWQPGGLYRDVRLRMVPQAFLADVFAKPVQRPRPGRPAGRGAGDRRCRRTVTEPGARHGRTARRRPGDQLGPGPGGSQPGRAR